MDDFFEENLTEEELESKGPELPDDILKAKEEGKEVDPIIDTVKWAKIVAPKVMDFLNIAENEKEFEQRIDLVMDELLEIVEASDYYEEGIIARAELLNSLLIFKKFPEDQAEPKEFEKKIEMNKDLLKAHKDNVYIDPGVDTVGWAEIVAPKVLKFLEEAKSSNEWSFRLDRVFDDFAKVIDIKKYYQEGLTARAELLHRMLWLKQFNKTSALSKLF